MYRLKFGLGGGLSISMDSNKCGVVIVAGGSGARAGGETPKQFQMVLDRPLYMWSLEAFLNWEHTGFVVLTVPAEWVKPVNESLAKYGLSDKAWATEGGPTRQESASLGLEMLTQRGIFQWTMVHDAARPMITENLLNQLWKQKDVYLNGSTDMLGGVIPGISAHETVKKITRDNKKNFVESTLNRSEIYLIQTPQLFKTPILSRSYNEYQGSEAVDDSVLVEKLGYKVMVVDGEKENIKVTFQEDFERVSGWLRKRHPPL